jgi:hypothetical protein
MDIREAEGVSIQLTPNPSGSGNFYPAGTAFIQLSNSPTNLENAGLDNPGGTLSGSTMSWVTALAVYLSGSATTWNAVSGTAEPLMVNFPNLFADFVRGKWVADAGDVTHTSGSLNWHIRSKG